MFGLCNRLLEGRSCGSPAPSLLFVTSGVLATVSAVLAAFDVGETLGLIVTTLIGIAMGCQATGRSGN